MTPEDNDDALSWTRVEIVAAILFAGVFLAAILFPLVALKLWGLWIGVAVGVAVPVAWIMVLPISCMNGGLHFAILAMLQCVSAIIWIIVGVVGGIVWLL